MGHKPVVTINIPGDPRKNNDTCLRGVADDASVETLRKLVTAMCADHKGYAIGKRTPDSLFKKRTSPARKPDEEVLPGVEVDAKVDAALDAAELVAA